MDIYQVNKHQFDTMLLREGRKVTVVGQEDGDFRFLVRTISSKTAQESITIFYSQDYDVGKGDVFELCGEHFLIINRRSWDSRIFYTSTAIRTNVTWNIEGKDYYLVCGDLSAPNPKHGSLVSTVNGSISLYTKKSNMIFVNESVYDFGGTYNCINKFDIDGLTYYYFSRNIDSTYHYEMKDINGVTSVTLEEIGAMAQINPQTIYTDSSGTPYRHYMLEGKIVYSSSDPSIATVDDDGIITAVADGTCTVTATRTITRYVATETDRWTTQSYSCDYTVTVNTSSVEPTPTPSSDYYAKLTYNGTTNTVKVGGSKKTITSHVFATDGDVEQEAQDGTWWLTWELSQTNQELGFVIDDLTTAVGSTINKWTIQVPDNGNVSGLNMQKLGGTILTVHWKNADGLTTSVDLEIINF